MGPTREKLPLPAIILAAGASRRFGGNKLLACYQGRPLLHWTLEKWNHHPLVESILLVVQPQSVQMAAVASDFGKVRLVENGHWKRGMGTSLAAGISCLQCEGVLVGLADTPFFEDRTLEMIVPSPEAAQNIRVPVFTGIPGHPKHFPSWTFAELKTLDGDEGAKSVIARYPERYEKLPCEDPGILRDFDRRADFAGDS